MKVDDYFDKHGFRCGRSVREKDGDDQTDNPFPGRHIGVVVATLHNAVRVKWNDTGWKTDFELRDGKYGIELCEPEDGRR